MQLLGRLAGVVLIVAAFAPLHRLLDPRLTGPAGAATRETAENAWVLGLTGTLIVVVFAWVVTRMTGAPSTGGQAEGSAASHPAASRQRPIAVLERIPAARFAAVVAVAAFVLSAAIAWAVHAGAPTSVDEMVQLAHARALLAGRLGLATEGDAAAWLLQNGVATAAGWVSIYPPLHTLLLALGAAVGGAWLVGPAAVAVATGATVLATDHLAGPVPARLAGLLLLISPFWLLIGSTHLSHTTAAAGIALTLLCAVRASDGSWWWALAAGTAMGIAISARPWVGLVTGVVLVATMWGPLGRAPDWRAGLGRRMGGLLLGGAPFAALLLGWNARLFGYPFRLGYSEAFGPSHDLGFHADPWGNRYGPLEAIGYTGADLSQLGVRLLESPLPVVGVVGFALLRRFIPEGARVFVMWAMAAVAANALYWHHGVHFGPRMLFESAPAWIALFAIVLAIVFTTTRVTTAMRVSRWALGISLVVGLAFTPFAFSAAIRPGPAALPPAPSGDVVFVHGSWSSRVASRLAAAGMTRDSIETLLRRNDVCAVDAYSRRRASGDSATPSGLDDAPLPGSPDHLESRLLSPGNGVRVDPGAPPSPGCLREARSDRLGVLELETVAWRVAGAPDAPVRYARDLGPAANLAVLEALGRSGRVLIDTGEASGLVLLDYDEGMELLWGGAAGDAATAGGAGRQ